MKIRGIQIKIMNDLEGCAFGLVDKREKEIYVSPAVYLLLQDESLEQQIMNDLLIVDMNNIRSKP